MGASLPSLLSFGLCLSLGITANKDRFTKPILWAKPQSIVAWGTDVILWCQGPAGVELYRLERLGSSNDYKDQPGLPGPEARARFPLGRASATIVGKYRCSYRNDSYWSRPSNQLELVVTDLYEKPSFTVLPGPDVSSGENVTFSCSSQFGFNMFAIAKEGRESIWKIQEGKSPVHFPIPAVTSNYSGIYRCYGYDNHFPYLWTAPSEPLELRIAEAPGTSSPTESNAPAGASTVSHVSSEKADIPISPISQDYTAINLLRLVLVGFLVAALGGLLAEAWQAWRREFHIHSGPLFQAQAPRDPQVKELPPQ